MWNFLLVYYIWYNIHMDLCHIMWYWPTIWDTKIYVKPKWYAIRHTMYMWNLSVLHHNIMVCHKVYHGIPYGHDMVLYMVCNMVYHIVYHTSHMAYQIKVPRVCGTFLYIKYASNLLFLQYFYIFNGCLIEHVTHVLGISNTKRQ